MEEGRKEEQASVIHAQDDGDISMKLLPLRFERVSFSAKSMKECNGEVNEMRSFDDLLGENQKEVRVGEVVWGLWVWILRPTSMKESSFSSDS
jgi:hypothetical protein